MLRLARSLQGVTGNMSRNMSTLAGIHRQSADMILEDTEKSEGVKTVVEDRVSKLHHQMLTLQSEVNDLTHNRTVSVLTASIIGWQNRLQYMPWQTFQDYFDEFKSHLGNSENKRAIHRFIDAIQKDIRKMN